MERRGLRQGLRRGLRRVPWDGGLARRVVGQVSAAQCT